MNLRGESNLISTCPYCGQGSLLKVTLKRINVESYICDECDVIWYNYADIGIAKGASTNYILHWLGYEPFDYHLAVTVHGPIDWPKRE